MTQRRSPSQAARFRVCIIGHGKLGRSLAKALSSHASFRITTLRGRSLEKSRSLIDADVFILATPDPTLRAAAETLGKRIRHPKRVAVMHCAGSKTAGELEALAAVGVATGVLHPLVSFSGGGDPKALRQSVWVFAGHRRAKRPARALVSAVGGQFVEAEIHGPLYHAAAVLAANGTAALCALASRMLVAQGLSSRDANRAIGRLVSSVADNVTFLGEDALTGPVRRGDVQTVRTHIEALREVNEIFEQAYITTTRMILEVARDLGVNRTSLEATQRLLTEEPMQEPQRLRSRRPRRQSKASSMKQV